MEPFVEFLSSNKDIKYPFSETANIPSTIPLDFIVDIVISTNDINEKFYISKIEKTEIYLRIFINDILFFVFPISTNNGYEIAAFSNNDYQAKILVWNTNLQIPNGDHLFSIDQTLFESTVVVPRPKIVSSINDLVNEINVAAGYNITIDNELDSISINSGQGLGIGRPPCDHLDDDKIYLINNKDIGEQLRIEGSACVRAITYPEQHLIVLNDVCEPCCMNCDEKLDEINVDLVSRQSDIDDLTDRIVALGG